VRPVEDVGGVREAQRPPLWMMIAVYGWALANFVLYGSVLIGLAFQSRRAAVIAIASFTVVLLMHLAAGVFEYRRTMRRPWPAVRPLTDDEDD
jgi:hypothetical protein